MDSKFTDTPSNDLSDGSKTPAVGFPCVDYDDDDDDDGVVKSSNIVNTSSTSSSDTNSTHTSTEDDHRLYPADCYSFLSLYGPRLNPGFFSFGVMVYLFQITFLILMVLSKVGGKKLGANGEVDNPSGDMIASFIHSNASYLVRATQFTALLCYVAFADASLRDVVRAVETFPRFDRIAKTDKVGCMVFSCTLRFTQGSLAITAALLLVITSSDVIDIILNFTAINFISALDDVAFELAKWGKYGPNFEKEAKRIEQLPLPKCMFRKHKHVRSMFTVGFFGLVLMSLMGAIIYAQESEKLWLTHTFRVEFHDSDLKSYTGCYNIDEDAIGRLEGYKRNVYKMSGESTHNAKFGYCKRDRRWILFKGPRDNACEAGENKLAQSSRTDTFDISTSYGDAWYSVSGTPLDLYLVNTLDDKCVSFDNGICDPEFNSIDYQYDGGDCCSATCSESACGFDGIEEAFGVPNISGDGFPDCRDPQMRPLTIYLDFVSSRYQQFRTYLAESGLDVLNKKYADVGTILDNIDEFVLDYINATGSDELEADYLMEHLSEEPEPTGMSPLVLDCDGKNVLSLNVNKSMTNRSQTVQVNDRAKCMLTIKSTASTFETTWYVNYKIFNDKDKGIQILQGSSEELTRVNFHRMPDCAVSELLNYVNKKSLSDDTSKKSIDWMMNDKLTHVVCENAFFIEKYALGVLNFAAPIKGSDDLGGYGLGMMKGDAYVRRWPSITCERGSVVKLGLDSSELSGKIAPEISLLTNLVEYNSYNNILTGTIPSEIGSLTKMESLSLTFNSLTGSIPSEIGSLTAMTELSLKYNYLTGSIPSEIGTLTAMTYLSIYNNSLTDSIPSEIGLLTSLEILDLDANSLTGFIPSEIGLLTSLDSIYLSSNSLTGSIPSEIGLLTALEWLNLASNFLTGSIPSEIGLLTSLGSLYLESNSLSGSIQSEIGLLTSLYGIQLSSNSLTGSIPSEIGLLTALEWLNLANNRLSGTIPSEISNVTSIKKIAFYNNSIDRDSIPSLLLPFIVEPCVVCNGEGSFDYVKSIDENVISWSDECSKNISDINNDLIYDMISVDECSLLIERCVVCHSNTNSSRN